VEKERKTEMLCCSVGVQWPTCSMISASACRSSAVVTLALRLWNVRANQVGTDEILCAAVFTLPLQRKMVFWQHRSGHARIVLQRTVVTTLSSLLYEFKINDENISRQCSYLEIMC
jgi:hypothetical protein